MINFLKTLKFVLSTILVRIDLTLKKPKYRENKLGWICICKTLSYVSKPILSNVQLRQQK